VGAREIFELLIVMRNVLPKTNLIWLFSLLVLPSIWLIWQTLYSRGAIFSAWWDIVYEPIGGSYCRADIEFQGTTGLITNCKNLEFSRWFREHTNNEPITKVSILPAQTLYYRTLLKSKPFPGLVIAWNDFGNFENTIDILENCFLKKGSCPGSLDALILFPTSVKTVEASWKNFGTGSEPFESFRQNKVENLIANYQGKDFNRHFFNGGDNKAFLFLKNKTKKDPAIYKK